MPRWPEIIAAAFLYAVSGVAQQPAETCAECHAQQANLHSKSAHAAALRPILSTGLPQLLSQRPIREANDTAYRYEQREDGLAVTATQGARSREAAALLEWVFGSGSQGRTPVGRSGGKWIEHRVSYYTLPGKPAITLGHPLEAPSRPADALGRNLSDDETTKCFRCHATGVRATFDSPDLSQMIPGVQCERCHGPARAHVEAARNGDHASIEAQRLSADQQLRLCGQCHRSGERDLRPGDPLNVRFQPVGLARSKCFKQSNALRCTTCHDPHEAGLPDASRTSAICSGCHAQSNAPPGCERGAQANCLPCHMPREQPNAYLEFTDHHIRIRP